jgi:hypothetical protein
MDDVVVVERSGRKVCYVGANCGAVQIPVPDTIAIAMPKISD